MYFIVIPHLLGIFFTPVICGFLNSTQFFLKISEKWDFPGALVVKTPHFSMQEAWVPPLVEELRPRMPHGVAKKKKKSREKFYMAKLYGQISFNPPLASRHNYRTTNSI